MKDWARANDSQGACVGPQGKGAACVEFGGLGWLRLTDVCSVQVQTALGAILRDPKAKELPCGVFGSFGWSGEAVDELEKRLKVWTLCMKG